MSIESRLKRGDDPEGIAKAFGVSLEHVQSFMPKKKPAKKKAAKKKVK